MDELVQTIENAAAKVDGADVVEKAAPLTKDVLVEGSTNGTTVNPEEAAEAALAAAVPVPEESVAAAEEEKKEDAAPAPAEEETKPENGVSSADPSNNPADEETPTTKTTTKPANEPTKEEQTSADVEAAEVTSTTVTEPPTTVKVVEHVDAASTVDAPAAADEPPPEAIKESTPEKTQTTTAEAEGEVEMVVEDDKVPAADLDTTLENSSDGGGHQTAAAGETVVDANQQTLNKSDTVVVLDDDSVIEVNDSIAVDPTEDKKEEPETPSAMEVTLEEPDKTLETPNVSICPMDKPQLLSNNRISELVLSNGSSTPNTSNPTSVEFQATPIKKTSIEEKLLEMEQEDETKFTTDASLSSQENTSKSSSDDAGLKRLQETLKQVNGTTTTTESSSSAAEGSQLEEKSRFAELADATAPESLLFDTVVNFQNGMLQCLIVDRVVVRPLVPVTHTESSDAASEKSAASNGSATSLGLFALPGALTHTASGLSVSSTSSAGVAGEKCRIQGVAGLRAFLQDLQKKLPEEKEEKKKPAGRGRGRTSQSAAAAAVVTPGKATTPTTPTRAAAVATPPKAVVEPSTAPATTSAKKQVAFAATTTSTETQVGNFVMARWTDKKYYAGRISAEKPGHKFQVRFEDGAQRTLARDQLVFGDKSVAAVLKNRECNVLVDPNIYETGLVVGIDAEACTYSVMTNSGTFTVPASDLYLDEEQAKQVQQGEEGSGSAAAAATATPGATTTTASGRRKRNSDLVKSSPEAGPSNVAEPAAKKSRKRQQPPPQIQSCDSQLSDISDTFDVEPKVPEVSYVEAVDGVQPELSKCPIQAKIMETCGYHDHYQNEDQLGGLPANRSIFRNKHVILTAPEVTRHPSNNGLFSDLPFDMEHLLQQLRCGGATIYEHFEEIPKAKYKLCVLITREPCLTARYIQCLAVNMVTVSHAWVIESCRQNKLMDLKAFALPAGWSMAENSYVRYVTGRNEKRANAHPFMGLSVLISSENEDFIKFWTRVCKFADAKVKAISSVLDISASKKTYLLTDSELQVSNVEKAKAVGIPIVSTAWVSECLIQGRPVLPEEHVNFTKANWDLLS